MSVKRSNKKNKRIDNFLKNKNLSNFIFYLFTTSGVGIFFIILLDIENRCNNLIKNIIPTKDSIISELRMDIDELSTKENDLLDQIPDEISGQYNISAEFEPQTIYIYEE